MATPVSLQYNCTQHTLADYQAQMCAEALQDGLQKLFNTTDVVIDHTPHGVVVRWYTLTQIEAHASHGFAIGMCRGWRLATLEWQDA